jgi:regulator of protease activity HflC (stomatin/prohibitin superfamily)
MNSRTIRFGLGALLIGFVVLRSVFLIDEAEQGIIEPFGEPTGAVIDQPGLHWRVPFIPE